MSRSKTLINSTVLAVYADNLRALSDAKLSNTMDAIEECLVEERITLRSLPAAVPEIVRRTLAEKSRQLLALTQELEGMLDELEQYTEDEIDRRDQEAEAKLPHCDKCGAVLQPKRGKR